MLFAILALHGVVLLYRRGRAAHLCLAGLFAGLTVLSHLEAAWFVAFSAVVLLAFHGINIERIRSSLAVGIIAAAVSAPWWIAVLARHGTGPFTAAQESGGGVFSGEAVHAGVAILRFISTSEPLLPIIGILAFLGFIVCLTSSRWLLFPVWWASIVLLDFRAFPTFTTLPIAMMAGIGVANVLLPALETARRASTTGRANAAIGLTMAALLVYAGAGALMRKPELGGEAFYLRSLSADERVAMRWVASATPVSSSFLLVPSSTWETEKTLEWFPALARRQSAATVQGSEWLAKGSFRRHLEIYDAAYQCGYEELSCLDQLETDYALEPTHIYIPKTESGQCCSTLLTSLLESNRYRLVYDGVGATVFADIAKEPIENGNYLSRQP
jgi:hypothetical protein